LSTALIAGAVFWDQEPPPTAVKAPPGSRSRSCGRALGDGDDRHAAVPANAVALAPDALEPLALRGRSSSARATRPPEGGQWSSLREAHRAVPWPAAGRRAALRTRWPPPRGGRRGRGGSPTLRLGRARIGRVDLVLELLLTAATACWSPSLRRR
jgi:hypothetical protein